MIDRSTAQFRILELLCEAYRQSGGTVILATSQIVARLELDGFPTSARAVRHQVAEPARKFDAEIDTARAGSVARHELVIHHALSNGAI